MIYQWKGYRFPIAPEVAAHEFEIIEQQVGILTAGTIVDAARAETSPLHLCFDWNDRVAAEKWRRSQAGDMLRALVMIEPVPDEKMKSVVVRAFASVRTDNVQHYIPMIKALSDDEYRQQILDQAAEELLSFRQKYHEIQELAEVINAIDRILT